MLGKFVHEVMAECTMTDINNWVAYDKIKTERLKRNSKKNKR